MRTNTAASPSRDEIVRIALEKGYYEVPRATTLTELGDELGISDVEVSKELRRASQECLSGKYGRQL